MIEWFSAVTTRRPVRRTSRRIPVSSSGLMVGDVQDRDVDAVRLQFLGGVESPHGHETGRYDQDVTAAAQQGAPAQFEAVVVFVQHLGDIATQNARVDRAGVIRDRRDHLLDFTRVAGIDHRHVWHRAEDGDVVRCLMARPVAGCQPRRATDQLHIGILFGNGLRHEVIATARGEGDVGGVGGGERNEALLGQPPAAVAISCSDMPIW